MGYSIIHGTVGVQLRYLGFVIVTSLVAVSCATSNTSNLAPVFMIEQARHQINSSLVVVGVNPHSAPSVIVPSGNSGQSAGLIGVIVESVIVSGMNSDRDTQERMLVSIRSAAIEYNFGSHFRLALEKQITDIDWLNVRYVMKAPYLVRGRVAEFTKNSQDDALLVVDCDYKLADDFSKLTVTSNVEIHPLNEKLTMMAKSYHPLDDRPVLYRNTFSYDYLNQGDTTDVQKAAYWWGSENGAMLHKGLDVAINELSAIIVKDLQAVTIEQRVSSLNQ